MGNLQVTVTADYHTVAGTSDQLLCTKLLRMILEANQKELERIEKVQSQPPLIETAKSEEPPIGDVPL